MQGIQPQASHRNVTIDSLRGFALFGIFLTHMITWFVGGPLPETFYTRYEDTASLFGAGFYVFFIYSKFFAIFAFLFGLSFSIQIENLRKKYINPALRFAWRLCILGVIAVLHHCFWRADVLTIYVPLGFLLLFCRNLSNKTLLIIGILMIFNIPGKIIELTGIIGFEHYPLLDPGTELDSQAVLYAVTQANFQELIQHNAQAAFNKLAFQINSGRTLVTFGFFLLGMLIGRLKWHTKLDQIKDKIKKICKALGFAIIGLIAIGGLLLLTFGIDYLKSAQNNFVSWISWFWYNGLNACVTVFYISGFVILIRIPRFFKSLSKFAYAGRMALTVYILQSIIGVFLFFNIGLGLFQFTSPIINSLIAIGIFILQGFFCRRWLRYFKYGPIEWFWRSSTEFKWLTLKKIKSASH